MNKPRRGGLGVASLALALACVVALPVSVLAARAPTAPGLTSGKPTVGQVVTATRAPTAPKLSPAKPTVGQMVTAKGKLGTKVKRPVTLQVKSGGKWRTMAKGKSSSKGAYVLTGKAPGAAGTYDVRVVAKKGTYLVGKKARKLGALVSKVRKMTVVVVPTAPPLGASASATPPTPPKPTANPTPPAPTPPIPTTPTTPTTLTPTTPTTLTPTPTPTTPESELWASVTAGYWNHTCGIRRDGSAWCWGGGALGELGNGEEADSLVPVRVSGGGTWASLTVGASHTCGLRPDKSAWCWGGGLAGALGDGLSTNSSVPVQVTGEWISLSAGNSFTCGVDVNATAWCWGYNAYGRLGNGTTTNSAVPVDLSLSEAWESVSAGGYHACGIRSGGAAWCWGWNTWGAIGIGSMSDTPVTTPVHVLGLSVFSRVSAGGNHTCALRSDGSASCWGRGNIGALGTGSIIAYPGGSYPMATTGVWADLTAGGDHTCGVRLATRTLGCVGENGYGQIGNGTKLAALNWTEIPGSWTGVSAGARHTCAVKTDGSAWCWGANDFGQLGTGDKVASTVPVEVS